MNWYKVFGPNGWIVVQGSNDRAVSSEYREFLGGYAHPRPATDDEIRPLLRTDDELREFAGKQALLAAEALKGGPAFFLRLEDIDKMARYAGYFQWAWVPPQKRIVMYHEAMRVGESRHKAERQ